MGTKCHLLLPSLEEEKQEGAAEGAVGPGWLQRCWGSGGSAPGWGGGGLSPQISEQHRQWGAQYTTSYTVAFLSPEPVTMNLSLMEMSQLSTEEDSLDWEERGWG